MYRAQGRELLRLQTRALDALIEDIAPVANGGAIADEVDRIVIWMLQAVGVSINSVLQLTTTPSMAIRDCFGIARSAAETAVNAAYISTGGSELAKRAYQHMRQKRWRDLRRTVTIGGQTTTMVRNINAEPSDFPGLQAALDEFTTKKGQEVRDWTPDNIQTRISKIEPVSKQASISLAASVFSIYRPSSELLHGSFYGVNYFWQGSLDSPVTNKADFEKLWLTDHFVSMLTCLYFAASGSIEAISTQRGLNGHVSRQRGLDAIFLDLAERISGEDPDNEHSIVEGR